MWKLSKGWGALVIATGLLAGVLIAIQAPVASAAPAPGGPGVFCQCLFGGYVSGSGQDPAQAYQSALANAAVQCEVCWTGSPIFSVVYEPVYGPIWSAQIERHCWQCMT